MIQLLQPLQIIRLLAAVPVGLALTTAVSAADEPSPNWRTGRRFHQQLQTPVGVTWDGIELAEALEALARSQRVAIFLDRRVDPNQPVRFAVSDVGLDATLRRLARQLGLGIGYVGPVVYVGPPTTAMLIATVAEMKNESLADLPPPLRTELSRRQPVAWPRLSQPRQLLNSWGAAAGIEIAGLSSVPYDVWRAADLPPLTMAERLTLALAGFELSFRWQREPPTVALTRFPRTAAIERRHPVGGNAEQLAERLQSELPQASVRVAGTDVIVESTLEDHWQIERIRAGTGPRPSLPGDKRYTLKAENQPVRLLLETVAGKHGLELVLAADAAPQLNRTISISVQNATAEELLDKIAGQAKLQVQMTGNTLHVGRAEK